MIITKYIPKTASKSDIDLHIHYADENGALQIGYLDFEYTIIETDDIFSNVLRIVVPDDFDWSKPIGVPPIHCAVGVWHSF